MWLSAAKRRMPSRNRLPICSNTAGEAIGMPRCWCRKNTTPPGVCNFWTNADRYSRSRHEMSNAVCPSSTSLIVTTRSPMTAHLHPDHPHRDGREDATAARKRPAQPAAGRSEAKPLWILPHEKAALKRASDQQLEILLELLEWSNGERISPVPCATTDWSVDAADHQPPAQPVGSGRAFRRPRAARRAGPGRPPTGRPGVLRTVPGPLRSSRWSAVDPDRDLPADDVLEVPLPAGL